MTGSHHTATGTEHLEPRSSEDVWEAATTDSSLAGGAASPLPVTSFVLRVRLGARFDGPGSWGLCVHSDRGGSEPAAAPESRRAWRTSAPGAQPTAHCTARSGSSVSPPAPGDSPTQHCSVIRAPVFKGLTPVCLSPRRQGSADTTLSVRHCCCCYPSPTPAAAVLGTRGGSQQVH